MGEMLRVRRVSELGETGEKGKIDERGIGKMNKWSKISKNEG